MADNDPGHDTLYVEEQGDSEIDGSLNITGNVSIEGILYSGSELDVRGDSVQATGSNNQIIGTSSILSIQSIGDLYINTFQGTTATVYFGDSASDSVNINVTGALYFGSNGRLAVSSGSQAGSDLYWGDKLICDASESNCGWVSSTTGGGDITAVNTNDDWLNGGAESGDVSLTFNESKLNDTIDARASAVGDGNNYTTAAGFVTSGSTETLQ
ncbi:hypothetical protein JXB28_00180, partial [Candidatus Woesearchaeota archaeon]|nr:hypothetical protein [Candidatus Woesearchaeota archaeon]